MAVPTDQVKPEETQDPSAPAKAPKPLPMTPTAPTPLPIASAPTARLGAPSAPAPLPIATAPTANAPVFGANTSGRSPESYLSTIGSAPSIADQLKAPVNGAMGAAGGGAPTWDNWTRTSGPPPGPSPLTIASEGPGQSGSIGAPSGPSQGPGAPQTAPPVAPAFTPNPVHDQNGNTTGLAPVSATAPIIAGQQMHIESGTGDDGWTKQYDANGNFSGQTYDGHANAGAPAATSYNYAPTAASPGGNQLISQSLNGGPLTDPQGLSLAPGQDAFGYTPQSGGAGSAPALIGPDGLPIADQLHGGNAPLQIASEGPGQYTAGAGAAEQGATPWNTASGGNPAGVDRVGLAKSMFDDFAKSSDPYYTKALRDATSQAAGAGRLGSGMLRTSLGDAASNRALQLDSARSGFLNNALGGSIDDAFRSYGLAQQDQSTAFNQAATQTQIEEALRNGDYSREMGLLSAGQQGNPSGTALTLANNYGNQASAAGQGAANLVAGGISGNAAQNAFQQWLAAQQGEGDQGLEFAAAPGIQQATDAGGVLPLAYAPGSIYQPPKPAGMRQP